MIVKKPKNSIITLIAVLLIAVTAAVICFSTTQQTNVPQMRSEQQASILEAWSEKQTHLNFETPDAFSDLTRKKDGIRYYGSFEPAIDYTFQDYALIYVPCTDSDTPTQLNINGSNFSSRTLFTLYIYCTAPMGDEMQPMIVEWKDFLIPEETIAEAVRIHAIYEEALYGSVLTEVKLSDDPTGIKEAQSTWFAYTGQNMDLSDSTKNYNDLFLGRHDGYLVVFFQSGHMAQVITHKQIGSEVFKCSHAFELYAVKDGVIDRLEDIYQDGFISDQSLSEISATFYKCYPQYTSIQGRSIL